MFIASANSLALCTFNLVNVEVDVLLTGSAVLTASFIYDRQIDLLFVDQS